MRNSDTFAMQAYWIMPVTHRRRMSRTQPANNLLESSIGTSQIDQLNMPSAAFAISR